MPRTTRAIFSSSPKKVYKYNPYTDSIVALELSGIHDPDHNVTEVKGSGGRYFVCEDSIASWDPASDRVTVVLEPLRPAHFKDAAMDAEGNIWVASTDGLGLFNPSTGAYVRIPSPMVESASSVICSPDGKVWVGSGGSLFVYLKDRRSFVKFDDTDGVYANNFSAAAGVPFGDRLLMGGSNGFVMIDPSGDFGEIEVPEFVLSDFYVDGSVSLTRDG